jgi:glutamate carboxypeptidase
MKEENLDRRFLPFVVLAVLSGVAQAQLADTEQRIVAAVKQRTPAALELLEKSVRINSGTLNPEGVRAVGEIYRAELEGLGFKTRWIEMPPAMKRAGHLVATHEGGQGKRILLLGHLDTVFEKGSSVPLWEQRGDRVRGQGVNDMKGGDVVMIEALRALASAGALDKANIEIMFTGDEERAGAPVQAARADMVAMGKRADYALSFEGSNKHDGVDTASIARRSSGGWVLRVKGKPAHSMGVFSAQSGYGAIYETARILNAFREQVKEPSLTFNPGLVFGGTNVSYADDTATASAFGKSNVIARDAQVLGDLRYLSPEQGERARKKMSDRFCGQSARHFGDDQLQRKLPAHAADRRRPQACGALLESQPGCGPGPHRHPRSLDARRGRRAVRRAVHRGHRRPRRARARRAHRR